jgi:hypothetical protein
MNVLFVYTEMGKKHVYLTEKNVVTLLCMNDDGCINIAPKKSNVARLKHMIRISKNAWKFNNEHFMKTRISCNILSP